ncbi:uncharacterized protein LOC119431705 [Dermacentor silvarum]|uniref:uncharacterized protein LOC119431705 n=1 Tax=Dermacentor silvarum TaxID=543639 RepID=UPI0021015175|nr:uncharacterized protein LOC119431705 [Dermacentor silvarum]
MSSICPVCSNRLSSDGRFLSCVECKNGFHLGKTCSGVAESTFLSMGSLKRESWKCKHCRSSTGELSSGQLRNSAASAEADDPSSQLGSLREQLQGINDMVVTLLPLKEKVDQLLALKPRIDEVLSLRETVLELQSSVQYLATGYDTVLAQTKESDSAVKGIETQVESLTECVRKQSEEIAQFRAERNKDEQYSRLSNLELHGLPFSSGEDLRAVISELAQKLALTEFNPRDVVAVHRLPARKDKVPPVLVRFSGPSLRDTWLAARRKLRDLAQKKLYPMMYLNENLTQTNKELFWKARTKGKESSYKYVWVKNGKIFARKEDGGRVLRIATVDDVDKMT